MRRIIYLFLCLILVFSLSGCGKKKPKLPELEENSFITLSSHQEGDVDELKDYKITVSVDQSGRVVVVASDFKKWYSEDECPILELTITAEQVEAIKESIVKNDFYHLNENIGSRDMLSGEYRSITVLTKEQEYTTYGLNISNRRFNSLYDSVIEQFREAYYGYIANVNKIQRNALDKYNRRGISVYDAEGVKVLGNKDIVAFEKILSVDGPSILKGTKTDAEEDTGLYYISFTLNDDGVEKLKALDYDTEVRQLQVYVDDEFAYSVIVDYTTDKHLYITQQYTESDAADKVAVLNGKLVR